MNDSLPLLNCQWMNQASTWECELVFVCVCRAAWLVNISTPCSVSFSGFCFIILLMFFSSSSFFFVLFSSSPAFCIVLWRQNTWNMHHAHKRLKGNSKYVPIVIRKQCYSWSLTTIRKTMKISPSVRTLKRYAGKYECNRYVHEHTHIHTYRHRRRWS